MTTVKQHLDKVKKKAHRTQKDNGHFYKMNIKFLRNLLKKRNERIRELEREITRLSTL